LYIDPQGIIKACPYFPLEIADAKKGELEKIWFDNDLFNKLRRIRSFLTGRCEECKYKFACGGCRGAALAFGDIFGEDPRCWHGL
jgi:radical SAM protein with 4Fe4S-binding SPASM domain